jgi:glycosyltransferase involved in cell wall biosynthesis
VLAGSGPLRERCEQQAEALGIAGQVLFLGEVPFDNLPEEYARACIDLLRDPARRDRLAAAGHPKIMADFSFERFANVVGNTIHSVFQPHAPYS